MAGIFPAAGTAAANTSNAASPVNTTPGCDPLYHRVGCVPVFDPSAANAVISEIVNAVNTLQPYDCTRLDNLANVLATISDLCKLPTLAEVDVDAPDLDDTLAGCFDGKTAQVNISALAALINAQKSLCGLQDIGAINNNDYLAVCANPGNGYQDRKINFGALKQLLGGGSASALVRGNEIFFSGAHTIANIPTAGRDAMMAMAYYEIAGGDLVGDGTLSVATGGGGFVLANGLDNADAYIVGGSSNSPALTVPIRTFVNVIKKNNTWYLVVNGTAMPLGGDDGTIRFANGTWSKLTIWEASRF